MDLTLRTTNSASGKKVTIIDIVGDIDSEHAPKFKMEIESIINKGNYNSILNFRGVNYINSTGLGVVAAALKKSKENKGELKVLNLNPAVKEIFELIRFTKIIKVYNDEKEAIESYS